MINYIDTEYYRIEFNWDWEQGNNDFNYLHTPLGTLDEKYYKFLEYINKYQFEIKATMPLTTAIYKYEYKYDNHINQSFGFGYGLGTTQITGMIAILQRQISISEDDYKRIVELLGLIANLKGESVDLQKRINALLTELNEQTGGNNPFELKIREENKFFGGKKYFAGTYECNTREEAEAFLARRKKAVLAECKPLGEAHELLEKNEIAINNAMEELKSIKHKYVPIPQD